MKRFKKIKKKARIAKTLKYPIVSKISYNKDLLRTQLYALKCILFTSDSINNQINKEGAVEN